MRWQRYIRDASRDLPPGYRKSTLLAYCLAMATYGYNGLGCYASDETMRRNLDLSNRRTVAGYRRLAKDLGWLAANGKRGRSEVLDISVPQAHREPHAEDPPVAEHDHGRPPATCPACQPLIAQVSAGKLTWEKLRDIHAGIVD